jgi:hypothetical protein
MSRHDIEVVYIDRRPESLCEHFRLDATEPAGPQDFVPCPWPAAARDG